MEMYEGVHNAYKNTSINSRSSRLIVNKTVPLPFTSKRSLGEDEEEDLQADSILPLDAAREAEKNDYEDDDEMAVDKHDIAEEAEEEQSLIAAFLQATSTVFENTVEED
eukprot:scaffold3120_cov167-Ochromonas_danica.AAC.10